MWCVCVYSMCASDVCDCVYVMYVCVHVMYVPVVCVHECGGVYLQGGDLKALRRVRHLTSVLSTYIWIHPEAACETPPRSGSLLERCLSMSGSRPLTASGFEMGCARQDSLRFWNAMAPRVLSRTAEG